MKLSERGSVTVNHIRKVHSLWDKAKRDMDGVCKKAVAHPNTSSCKSKDDLEALFHEGTILDRIIMDTEIKHLVGAQLSSEDIMKTDSTCEALSANMKAAQARMVALRNMWQN